MPADCLSNPPAARNFQAFRVGRRRFLRLPARPSRPTAATAAAASLIAESYFDARMLMATLPRISAPATSMRAVTASPSTSQAQPAANSGIR